MRSFRIAVLWLVPLLAWTCVGLASGASQDGGSPNAQPRITRVQPHEAQPGSQVTVKIEGEHFAPGSYVSFSDPAIHVLSTHRKDETQLDVKIAVGDKAQRKSVLLYVTNSSGVSAETSFVVGSEMVRTSHEIRTSSAAPQLTKVDPAKAEPGSKISIKVNGKNFKEGVKVAFSNPGIRVLETEFKKSTQLIAQIEVSSNAPTGNTSLFVVNPDESEAEVGFEVGQGKSASSGAGPRKTNVPAQRFNVYNLGDATTIFRNPGQAQGQLVLEDNELKYEQDGKVVFTAKASDIQEIAPNEFFGLNTGTFHIILNSGKTYNFVSSSLSPADTNSIVESLRRALK